MLSKISKIFLVLFALFIILAIVDGYLKKVNVENNGIKSIGKFIYQDKWAKGELNYFVYFINNKMYKGNGGRAPVGFKKNIGNFYKIIYSKKYKGTVIALFNEQIIDTTLILNAGFSKNDFKKKTYK